MMIRILVISFFLWSCGAKTDSQESVEAGHGDTVVNSIQEELVQDEGNEHTSGKIRVERITRGKNDSDFWQTGLKEVAYKIFSGDSLLTTVEIVKESFTRLYVHDFAEQAKIWDSEVLSIDTLHKKIIISSRFGQPESDNETNVLCIADFTGATSFMDSPPDCSSGTNISFGKIVTCNGVYNYSGALYEFTNCCTVFSDLINSRTLFYVIDREGETKNVSNAFLIDIITKDTLDRFVFNDFTQSLGYSALISNNKRMGLLAVLHAEKKELVTWDSLLNRATFDLTKIKTVDNLTPGSNTIDMYSETAERVIIEFNDNMIPIRWNK